MSLISEHLTPWMPEVVAREPTESDCVGASKHLIYSIQAKIVVNLLGLGASGCLGTKIGKPILVVVGFCPLLSTEFRANVLMVLTFLIDYGKSGIQFGVNSVANYPSTSKNSFLLNSFQL